jgi:hypothetical protein
LHVLRLFTTACYKQTDPSRLYIHQTFAESLVWLFSLLSPCVNFWHLPCDGSSGGLARMYRVCFCPYGQEEKARVFCFYLIHTCSFFLIPCCSSYISFSCAIVYPARRNLSYVCRARARRGWLPQILVHLETALPKRYRLLFVAKGMELIFNVCWR